MEEKKMHNLENIIIADIKSGKVKLRSRYLFLSDKLGLGSAVVLTVLLAALAFTVVLFYFVSADSRNYLEFGNSGIWAFLESFPFQPVITLILLIFLAGRLLSLTGRAYAYSFGKLSIIVLVIIFFSGSIFAFANLGENGRGIAGQVVAVRENILIVRSPRSDIMVNTSNVNWRRDLRQPELGVFIIAVGQWQGVEFFASHIKLARPKDLRVLRPHIRRSIPEFVPKVK